MDNAASSYRRFLGGDESAFDEIMKELFDSLVFFIDRYVHDTAAAEDIAIDAFSDLLVHRSRYNFKVTLKTYLFMIGRSRALNYLKHHHKFEMTDLSEAEHVLSEDTSAEDGLLAKEREQSVHLALAKLPAAMREAVLLIYFDELSYEETAKVMKKNKKQIDNLVYRAKKELRGILGEEGAALL